MLDDSKINFYVWIHLFIHLFIDYYLLLRVVKGVAFYDHDKPAFLLDMMWKKSFYVKTKTGLYIHLGINAQVVTRSSVL